MIHESDMTSAERRRAEWEKIRKLHGKARVQYLWMYYKIWIVFLMLFFAGIGLALQIYQGIQEEELLSIAIADVDMGSDEQAADLEKDIWNLLETGDKNETVTVDTTVSSGDDSTSIMKRAVVVGTGSTDILICGEEIYENYESQGAFADWKDIMGDDCEKLSGYLEDNALDLASCTRWNSYELVSYKPVYVGVLKSSERKENVKQFIEFLLEEDTAL